MKISGLSNFIIFYKLKEKEKEKENNVKYKI